jgi:dTDP-4-dehydrorhamnose reductase
MIINKDDSQYSLKDEYDPQKIYWISKSKTDEQLLIYNPDALIIRPAQNFSSSGRWTHVPQLFSPFNSRDLINSCLDFLIHNESGIWYLDGDGIYSWPEIVRKMVLHPN